MPWIDVEQSSVDWLKMRCGCVSASNMWKVLSKLKRKEGESAVRAAYKMDKVAENLTGLTAETYVTPAMERGIELEPLARAAYEINHDVEVMHGGLFIHDNISKCVASPDGRIGEDGLLELKAPSTQNHIDLLLGGDVPEEYVWQVMTQLACAPERQYCDFVSYDPRMPKSHRLYEKRFLRDDAKIKQLEDEVCTFLLEVIAIIKKLEP